VLQSDNVASEPLKATHLSLPEGLQGICLKDIILEWSPSQGSEPIIKALNNEEQEVIPEILHLDNDPNYIQVGSILKFILAG